MAGLLQMLLTQRSAQLLIKFLAAAGTLHPNYNRWFKFQATGSIAKITVRRGGVYGTIARINAASMAGRRNNPGGL